MFEAIKLASELHQLNTHNRQIVFGLLNDLLERDKDKRLVRDENGEPFNRHGGVGQIALVQPQKKLDVYG